MGKRKGAMSDFAKNEAFKRKKEMVRKLMRKKGVRGSRIRAADPDAGQSTDLGDP